MAIDLYSLCPGGRGKKIKFCCPDHIKDLEQIDAFLEGEQFAAGLAFVENLEKSRPDCACLTEAKCLFQRMIGLWEQAYETAVAFAAREPKNVVAHTELAISSALLDKPQEAVSALIDAIENVEGDQFPVAIVQAMLTVGVSFYENGRLYPAIAVAKQLQAFAPQDQASNEFLYRCLGSENVPLMLKEQVFDLEAPADFEKKAEYDEAVRLIARGCWKKGRAILESLLPLGESWPNLFRNLGILVLWFAEEEVGRAYIERYLASPNVDAEDAVDMETFQFLRAVPTWDDVETTVKRTYTLTDFDAAFEKILSSRILLANPRLRAAVAHLEVPPKATFNMLTGPLSEKTENLTLAEVPTQFAFAFLFGKQTDREARLETYALPSETARVDAALTEILGALPPLESEEPQETTVLWTTNESTPRFQFRDGAPISQATVEALFDEHLNVFADKWFEHAYQILGGVSPKETLSAPNGARRVEALVRVVGSTFTPEFADKVMSILRAKAGLSAPEPIVPPTSFESKEETLAFFRRVPLWRWGRLSVETFRTDALVELLQIANLVAPRDVKEKFARETLSRPSGEMEYEARAIAYSIVVDAAVLAQDSDKALELIAEATEYAASVGQSDAQWNVLEFMTRFHRQEYDKLRDIAQHVFTEHQDDQQAVQTLQEFFARLNSAAQMQAQAEAAYRRQAQMQGGAAPASPFGGAPSPFDAPQAPAQEEKSSGLWTPGSDSGSSNGGSRLIIPD